MSEEPRTHSPVNAGRSLASIVLVGLLGLAGMVYLLWPKTPAVQRLEPSAAGSAWEVRPKQAVLRGSTMGTSFTVVLPNEGSEDFEVAELSRLQARVDAELSAVNAEMSTYLPDSELSRFNASGAGEPFEASEHLLEVVALAKRVSEQSGGAFDVSVGPLVAAWGFGADPRERAELSDAEIDALREQVGDAKLELDLAAKTLRKASAGLRIDLSAIAKGHGCDRVAALLEQAGHARYLVEIGGEVRARGSNPAGEPWRVGIERPLAGSGAAGEAGREGERVVQAILRVRDVAVATSGDYRNYWEHEGVRYSHTIDPRTGRPVTHRLASVTVIHPESAALADAWATALDVLGPDEGLALAERQGLAAYFLVRTDAGFEVRTSSAFEPYAQPQ
jgi:thiamine biosynthesis lipoprotein